MSSSSPTRRTSTNLARRVFSSVGRPLRRASRGGGRPTRITSPSSPQGGGGGLSATNNIGTSNRNVEYGTILTEEECESSIHSSGGRGGSMVRGASAVSIMSPFVTRTGSVADIQRGIHREDPRDWIVHSLEGLLLRLLVVLGAYLLGTYYPQYKDIIWKVGEYTGIAWITCVIIMIAAYVQSWAEPPEEEDETIPLIAQDEHEQVIHASRQLLVQPLVDIAEEEQHVQVMDEEAVIPPPLPLEQPHIPSQNHSELEKLYIMDATNGQRLIPNNPQKPYKFDTTFFEGYFLVMLRTSDADGPAGTGLGGTPENTMVSSYMRPKQRRFEFQYQLKLKKVPRGKIFFACELQEPPKMGMVQRAFVGAAMSFVKKMNNGFHYSISGSKSSDGKKYEDPHLAFTVEGSMDRLVVTPPDKPPPKLGQEIVEDPESVKQRKKGTTTIDWNTRDTYTFAMWSAYCDFIQWRVINLPGVRPFNISSVAADQHMNLTLYVIPPSATSNSDKHYVSDRELIADFEFSNLPETKPGPCAQAWDSKYKKMVEEPALNVSSDAPLLLEEEGEDDEDEEVEEDDQDDWATVAELGEGMYLKSGDRVILKESVTGGDINDGLGCVTIAGGFAVLQNQASSTIVVEKARRSRGAARRSKQLIKSGDTVMIKLISKSPNGEQTDTKFLSVHRGWWLKWVSIAPTKNGFFTIYTQETEFHLKDDGKALVSSEPQSSYLMLNGTFWLRHKRWSKYKVGVSNEESATYGGRMLGLCRHDAIATNDEGPGPDDEDDADLADMDKEGQKWMRTLYLAAHEASSVVNAGPRPSVALKLPGSPSAAKTDSKFEPSKPLVANIDVPAWIEMMHRTDRRPALVYVVRVLEESLPDSSDESLAVKCYLRTGRNVAEVIRAFKGSNDGGSATANVSRHGKDKRKHLTSSHSGDTRSQGYVRGRSLSAELDDQLKEYTKRSASNEIEDSRCSAVQPHHVSQSNSDLSEKDAQIAGLNMPVLEGDTLLKEDASVDQVAQNDYHYESNETDDQFGSDSESLDSGNESSSEDEDYEPGNQQSDGAGISASPGDGRKKRKIMEKIAKSMKAGTNMTGKQVVRQGKKVGKGTVTAGKAIISPISRGAAHPKKPPRGEPKSKVKGTAHKRGNRRRKQRDHHVAVRKAVKGLERKRSQRWLSQPPSFLAGQLCAPDQSCRTASHVLSKMVRVQAASSSSSEKFNKVLSRHLGSPSHLDRWFLQGGSIELGIVPAKTGLTHESLVARCLWESHWREEWCGIYEDGVKFYAPLTKQPSLELSFSDVRSIRKIDSAVGSNPLPGLSILAIETAWRCHYMAFSGNESRQLFNDKMSEAIFLSSNSEASKVKSRRNSSREKDLSKARFWQGFQSSVESSLLSSGTGKWAKVASAAKKGQINRTVLNGRRMIFDIDPISNAEETDDDPTPQVADFVAGLLTTSLTFSLHGLESDPDSFVNFLDLTSQLRSLPLQALNLANEASFCVFVNLYHCLLQHALLLSVNGPCHKRSVGNFMRSSCYEIGGDVFSLAELNSCVVRGKMSRPVSPKAPYVEAPKKSSTYRFYALDFVDPRTNFLLNSADLSCPQSVPVLKVEKLEEELTESATLCVQNQLSIDYQKKTVLLPKVCDVYKHDFGNGDAKHIMLYCVKFLKEGDQIKVLKTLRDDSSNLKYQPLCDQYHLFLTSRESSRPIVEPATLERSTSANSSDPLEVQVLEWDELERPPVGAVD